MGDSVGVVFTGPDKALLDRMARMAEGEAKALGWEALQGKARKQTKLVYDRLMRDAHDLRLMGVRLTKVAKMLRSPAEKPSASVVATAPFPGPDQRAGIDRRKGLSTLDDAPGPERRLGGPDRRAGG